MACPFEYTAPSTRILRGPQVLERLAHEVDALGASRLMLVHGRHIASTRLLAKVKDKLGPRVVLTFGETTEHPDVYQVMRAAESARAAGVDGLVSIGGGSASDTAKAINILLAEEGSLPEHASTFVAPDKFIHKELRRPKFPLVALPTTCSGAEMTPGAGIRNEQGVKLLFWDNKLVSRIVLLAPECVAETPLSVLTTTAMNGLAHCIEGLYSRHRNPISDGLALHGIRLFATALPRLVDSRNDAEALATIQVASVLGGMVISNARVGIHHAVCHCLGARLAVPHGVVNAIMLPYAMRFNIAAAADQLALVGAAMGVPHADPKIEAEKAVAAVFALQMRINVPRRLRDVGIDRSLLPQVAQDTMQDRGLYFNPRHVSDPGPVLQLLEDAW